MFFSFFKTNVHAQENWTHSTGIRYAICSGLLKIQILIVKTLYIHFNCITLFTSKLHNLNLNHLKTANFTAPEKSHNSVHPTPPISPLFLKALFNKILVARYDQYCS